MVEASDEEAGGKPYGVTVSLSLSALSYVEPTRVSGRIPQPQFDLREMVRLDIDEVNTATTICRVKLTDGVLHDVLSHVRGNSR